MSKVKSSQKKVTLSELNNHTVNNKRQSLKDLKMLDFNDLVYKNAILEPPLQLVFHTY